MRDAFARTLAELAVEDKRILLLTGDLGYMALEPFFERFPDRFFNVGVAEQNMVGLATGLAEAGFMPFVYSIAPFVSLRPYEFIRNGPILHQFPVRMVGVGGGFEYGQNGASHYGVEDVGVMRIQPGMTVVAPADYEQARTALLATYDLPGPVYYRLGKDNETLIPGLNGRFDLGHVQVIHYGKDVLMLAMGSIATEAATAAVKLSARGILSTVAIVASMNPAPSEDLAKLLSGFSVSVTVEAHYIVGGLGSLISETVAERGLGCRVVRCGIRGVPDGLTGSQRFMHRMHGLSSEALVDTVIQALHDAKCPISDSEISTPSEVVV